MKQYQKELTDWENYWTEQEEYHFSPKQKVLLCSGLSVSIILNIVLSVIFLISSFKGLNEEDEEHENENSYEIELVVDHRGFRKTRKYRRRSYKRC